MKNLLFIIMLLGVGYSQCNESNWQEYYPSMAGCYLAGANLVGADLSGADLTNANLSYGTLWLVDLSGADLTNANLSYASLYDANLSYTDLEGACLEGASGFTQNNYEGTPILEGCADTWSSDCSDDVCYEVGYIAGHSDGVVFGMESVDITIDNQAVCEDCYADGEASVDTNNDGLVDDFPLITILGSITVVLTQTHEANYIDDGASCFAGETNIFQNVEVSGDIVNLSNIGTYVISYNCQDNISGNQAQTKYRTVIVQADYSDEDNDGYDDICYEAGYIAGHSDGVVFGMESVDITIDNQAVCEDCYADGEASVDTNSDGLVDEFPVITVLGGDVQILTQTDDDEYTDAGANCQDAQDGSLSQDVEVSGQVVNLRIIGSYTLYYDCVDSDDNQAITKSRTVVVQANYSDEDEDGYDDYSYANGYTDGAESGDLNLDGTDNVLDVVILVDNILNP